MSGRDGTGPGEGSGTPGGSGRSPQLDAFSVDVREVLQRSVANLYSHLITRPTGRAVRLAIENQLDELGRPALSLVDLSSVAILDYSCADEVVAKLILRAQGDPAPTYFVFHGVREHHREPIESALERHTLAAVAETGQDRFELLGSGSEVERLLWSRVEEEGRIPAPRIREVAPGDRERESLEALVARRLLFRHPLRGDLHALSTLTRSFE
jgi:hypothetical protein